MDPAINCNTSCSPTFDCLPVDEDSWRFCRDFWWLRFHFSIVAYFIMLNYNSRKWWKIRTLRRHFWPSLAIGWAKWMKMLTRWSNCQIWLFLGSVHIRSLRSYFGTSTTFWFWYHPWVDRARPPSQLDFLLLSMQYILLSQQVGFWCQSSQDALLSAQLAQPSASQSSSFSLAVFDFKHQGLFSFSWRHLPVGLSVAWAFHQRSPHSSTSATLSELTDLHPSTFPLFMWQTFFSGSRFSSANRCQPHQVLQF